MLERPQFEERLREAREKFEDSEGWGVQENKSITGLSGIEVFHPEDERKDPDILVDVVPAESGGRVSLFHREMISRMGAAQIQEGTNPEEIDPIEVPSEVFDTDLYDWDLALELAHNLAGLDVADEMLRAASPQFDSEFESPTGLVRQRFNLPEEDVRL